MKLNKIEAITPDEALHYAKLHYDSLCNSNNLIDLSPFIK